MQHKSRRVLHTSPLRCSCQFMLSIDMKMILPWRRGGCTCSSAKKNCCVSRIWTVACPGRKMCKFHRCPCDALELTTFRRLDEIPTPSSSLTCTATGCVKASSNSQQGKTPNALEAHTLDLILFLNCVHQVTNVCSKDFQSHPLHRIATSFVVAESETSGSQVGTPSESCQRVLCTGRRKLFTVMRLNLKASRDLIT